LNALGTHLLLELRDCNPSKLNDLALIQNSLLQAAREAGATVIGQIFHQFSPHGVTGVVAISESHLCVHTWPEFSYAAMDIFSCSETFDPRKVAQLLIERLESKDPEVLEFPRGDLKALVPSRQV
jgi:S-adenosylmethionine decarboxylase